MDREFPEVDRTVPEIEAAELKRRLDSGENITLLDTRRPADFEAWKLTHPNLTSVNVPFTAFLDENGQEPAGSVPAGVPSGPLVTSCAKGLSSKYVGEFLASRGREVTMLADGMEGWAALYEKRPLSVSEEGVTVVQLHRPSSGCLSYLLVSGDEAAVVDPLRAFTSRYPQIASAYGASLKYAIDTHVHADHVSGVRQLAAEAETAAVLPAGATDRGLDFDARLVDDGGRLQLGGGEIRAVALPGHTTEMMGYRFAGVLIGGDTVFLDGVARPDLEESGEAKAAAETLWETLQSLTDLPDDLTLAPGHAGPTTVPDDDGAFAASLGDLRARLGAFGESREEFVGRITSDLPPQPKNYEKIIEINLGRDRASSEEAFELELGPNNCAVPE